jgi:microcystin-dependent protein
MSQSFIGQLMYVSFNFAPKGWAMCNGQTLSIQQNAALFSLLGTSYGGNGVQTFALPNMQSRAPVHNGQGPGLSPYTLGEQTGTQTHTLLTTELPAHIHTLSASTTNGTTQEPATNVMLSHAVSGGGTMQPDIYAPSGGSQVPMANQSLANTGGSQPFTLLKPYLTVNCCIALVGIFPSRN